MNKTLLIITLFVVSSRAHALVAGSEGGGGGAQIESSFRIRARELTASASFYEKANALCPPAAMKAALASKIRVVKEINDPNGRCKSSQELDACTYPGDIQLKVDSWEKFFGQPQTKIGTRGIDALILHEIYRASPGCIDENFVITDQVFPLVEATPAALAGPKYTSRSCFYTEERRLKDGTLSSYESSNEDIWVDWTDVEKTFSLSGHKQEVTPGDGLGFIHQALTIRTLLTGPEHYFNTVTGQYFDVTAEGKVSISPLSKKFEIRGNKITKGESIDVTNADSSKNLGKVVHTVTIEPNGNRTKVEEQVSPDPVEADGSQRLSHKNLCNVKIVSADDVGYSGVFKVKAQIEKFSQYHEKAMEAKDLWQTCQEQTPDANCDLKKQAFEKQDKDRTAVWNDLIKKSDLSKKKETSTTTATAPADNRCAKMNKWFNQCLNLAQRHGPFCPMPDSIATSMCMNVGYWYQYCTGRTGPWYCRPNMR